MNQVCEDMVNYIKNMPNHNVQKRIIVVLMVLNFSYTQVKAAEMAGITPRTVFNWITRYQKEGIEGLKDKSGRGRKPKVSNRMFEYILGLDSTTTVQRILELVFNITKVRYHPSTIRRRMRELRRSAKSYVQVHFTNRASDEMIKKFQRANISWISRLNNMGFLVMAVDEMHINTHTKRRVKSWSRIGEKIRMLAVAGKAERITIFGGISTNGKICHTIRHSANSKDFIAFMKIIRKMRPMIEPIILILDGASCHTSQISRRFAKENNIKLVQLPAAVPELNASEALWKQFRQYTPVNKVFKTLRSLEKHADETMKIMKCNANVMGCLKRKIITPKI